MFNKEEWILGEAEIRSIRALGDTQGGKDLSKYIEREVQKSLDNVMMRVDATDAHSVAYAQAQGIFGRAIWSLLNNELDQLLEVYNQETEEEDDEERD